MSVKFKGLIQHVQHVYLTKDKIQGLFVGLSKTNKNIFQGQSQTTLILVHNNFIVSQQSCLEAALL